MREKRGRRARARAAHEEGGGEREHRIERKRREVARGGE